MAGLTKSQRLLICALGMFLALGCGGLSGLQAVATDDFPAIPPTPSTSTASTGSSPLSGDWNATPEFGRLAFTVDATGANVTTLVVGVANWTCGGTTLTTEVQSIGPWTISNNEFSTDVELDSGVFNTLTVTGAYDAASKTFSGTWDDDAHGTKCSGTWASVAHQ
jgi:hypothetical protein